MDTPEVIHVLLYNQDSAVYVNGTPVYTLDSNDSGETPLEVADKLAESLQVELQTFLIPVPTDDDWNWDDVYELLPPLPTAQAAHT